METQRRDQITRSLRNLAQTYAAELMEQTLKLLDDAFAIEQFTKLQARPKPQTPKGGIQQLLIEPTLLSVTFRGKTCFLGNTLPFKLLSRLAQRPNAYVRYEDLLSEVWQRIVSDSAVRTVAKNLRNLLRQAGLAEIAEAIDGSVYRHYALRLVR